MLEVIKGLIGPLPPEFEFAYIILVIVLGLMLKSLLFTLFYIPINMVRGK